MEEPLELIEVQELWRHVGFIRHHHCLYVNPRVAAGKRGKLVGSKTALHPLSFYAIYEFHHHPQIQIININSQFIKLP